jgi:xanthine/uracil permease
MPVKPTFVPSAILSIIIMFLVTAVETIGDISGCIEGGMGREATAKELSGGIVCDGIGSVISSLFSSLPTTSFSQNVGLVTMTKVVNRMALTCGAIFLILAGLSPKLAAVVSIMPQPVLGGAAVMMFASIAVSGIKLITKHGITNRIVTIVSISMGLGYGLGATSGALTGLPEQVQLIFGGSGIVAAAVLAILLNIIIPKEHEDYAAEEAAAHMEQLKAQKLAEKQAAQAAPKEAAGEAPKAN